MKQLRNDKQTILKIIKKMLTVNLKNIDRLVYSNIFLFYPFFTGKNKLVFLPVFYRIFYQKKTSGNTLTITK